MAFAMVFVCGILCDTGVIDIQMYASHRSSHDHDQFDHDHFWMVSPSYGEDDHGDDEYDKTNQTTHHQHEKTDDCCEEAREEWLATIVQQESPEFQIVKIPVLLLDVKLPDSFVIISEIVERRYEFRCALSPPGSQIRILLQSFLC